MKIPVEVSARHAHLTREDFEKLFGKEKQLTFLKKISQPGQFAAKEKIILINGKEKLEARIVGPFRSQSQVEISKTDAIKLRVNPPLRVSGNIKNTPGIIIQGTKNKLKLKQGLIIAQRHLHISDKEAKKLNIKNNSKIQVKIPGKRDLIFNNIAIRIGPSHKLSFQLDTDEGNAAGINIKTKWAIISHA